MPLWQVLVNLGCTQFSANPSGMLDLMLKSTSTLTNGGDVTLEMQYIRD